ncbi:MAG: MaoC/PaaZ C-terminal domain-containing protein, partial [Pseudomonadota bacterium]|nr:MaoC/PaaZ C-terminal domain-containing protein [Pseudomonadota bacterium]
MNNSFPGPGEDKYFEDYEAGRVYELGSVQVELAEVVEFATRYDPQYFHIDESRAKESIYGGIIASGWHTASMMMRVFADNFLSDVSSMGSPGLDELRWY